MHTNILRITILIAVLAPGAFVHTSNFAQGVTEAERLLQKAMQKETVDGDLKAAIEQYKKILARRDASRAVASKALFQLGQCQERLGNAEARKSYEQLVREYPDQVEVAVQARLRLSALTKTARASNESALAVRQVWAGALESATGAVSPDGRFLSFADYSSADLAVRELATGNTRRVTNHKGTGLEHWQSSSFSPDGNRIAYICQNGWDFELRTIGLDGSNPRVLIGKEFWKGALGYPDIVPGAWSADGKHILVSLWTRDKPIQIALVTVQDGSVQILKTLDWRNPGHMCLSPDGRYIAYDFPQKENAKERDIFLLASDGGREIPLVQHPATDLAVGWTPDGKGLLFASDRTGTMDLWFVRVDQGKPQDSPVLVKKEVGNITPLGLTRDSSLYYGLSVGMEDVYVATLDATTGKILSPPAALSRRYTGGNLAPDWSPDGKYIAYSSKRVPLVSGGNSRNITIRSVESGEERELQSKVDPRYNLRWSPDGRAILVVGGGPENQVGAYVVNAQTGDITASLPWAFWAEWSRDGQAVFYLHNNPDKVPLLVRDLKTGQERDLWRVPVGSISASPDGKWLAFSSADSERKVSTLNIMPAAGGDPRVVLTVNKPEDFMSIVWSPDGRHLYFARRNVSENRSQMWRIAVEGGAPQNLGLPLNLMSQISIHPDGRRIAYNFGISKSEVWVMENLLAALKSAK